jgi:hypothetical protein
LALNRAGFTPFSLVDRHHAVASRHGPGDQRALPRTGHTRQHHQDAERDVHVDVLQVVQVGTAHFQRAVR